MGSPNKPNKNVMITNMLCLGDTSCCSAWLAFIEDHTFGRSYMMLWINSRSAACTVNGLCTVQSCPSHIFYQSLFYIVFFQICIEKKSSVSYCWSGMKWVDWNYFCLCILKILGKSNSSELLLFSRLLCKSDSLQYHSSLVLSRVPQIKILSWHFPHIQ